ncbi:MAG: PTS system mannose-specific EIID component [Gemmatimonadaceae bacterium]|nr:PTS system mannose-specific EIID component [Gemmatimonadaceae bacterium]
MTTKLPVTVPWMTQASMFVRLLAIQASWNYEGMLGNGIAFCMEPALRLLPGGVDGVEYRAALGRQSQYFNANPYLASVAVGALVRAELEHEEPERIARFRKALCGPLGSVGDRLVWAALLPTCALAALAVFGWGGGAMATVVTFLGFYNAINLALRAWGLRVGLRTGIQVAHSLGTRFVRHGPRLLGSLALLLAGFGLPLVVQRIVQPGVALLGGTLAVIVVGGVLLARLHGRVEGWKVALVAQVALILLWAVK